MDFSKHFKNHHPDNERLQHSCLLRLGREAPPAEPISSDNGLDEKDRAIIQCILQNSSSSKQEIAEITSIPLSTVKYRISKLSSAEVIRREGSNKKGLWVVNKEKL
ncbi:MAG: winged helix-turn-helix transcriptional regulator [Candidatus Methanomethylophilaceae archaeon]|nr:winged helix-turn-helix transcriptional regulator [Candidatus Methanomethylophilaceae archaeon]